MGSQEEDAAGNDTEVTYIDGIWYEYLNKASSDEIEQTYQTFLVTRQQEFAYIECGEDLY